MGFNDYKLSGGDSPCKGCTERYVGCHSECEKYITYVDGRKEQYKKNKERIEQDQLLYDIEQNSMKNGMRNLRSKYTKHS